MSPVLNAMAGANTSQRDRESTQIASVLAKRIHFNTFGGNPVVCAQGKAVLEVIERVNRELGTTTAVITHNAALAGMADRVVSVASGRISQVRINERKQLPRDLQW